MNKKFFALPIQKQEGILNAGFCVFSQNSYKKSPTSEIADAAGISKSLLFHYFYNKRELYLFLWEKCAQITMEALEKSGCYEQTDLFDSMNLGLQAKLEIMRRYPHMGTFVMKAYYEKDPDVRPAIQESIAKYADFKTNTVLLNLNPEHFIEGLDLEMMYLDMLWASEGYIWEKLQHDHINVDEIEADFIKLIDFWKSIYLRKER